MKELAKNILTGFIGLMSSRKGTLTLIIITAATIAVMYGKIDGMAYVGSLGVAQAIYCWVQGRVDRSYVEGGSK